VAKIFVWYPTFQKPQGGIPKSASDATRKALSGIENVGHAAIQLEDGTYISWWPDTNVDEDFRSPGFSANSYQDDVRSEGSAPGFEQQIEGLEEGVMRSWWTRVSLTGFAIPFTFDNNPKTPNFDLRNTNCSSIVSIALHLGNADKILPFPRFDLMTPLHIAAWAKTAGALQAVKKIRF